MKRIPTLSGLISCLLLAGLRIATAENATIDALGLLPGRDHSYAFAVSDDGRTVVGGSATNRSYPTPFAWHSAFGITPLPPLNAQDGRGLAQSISADGSTAVGNAFDANGNSVPVRWRQGQVEQLPTPVPGQVRAPLADPVRSVVISADGSTIAGVSVGNDGGVRLLRWRQGAPETLYQTVGGISGIAISDNGNGGLILKSREEVLRWHDPIGVFKTRISPAVVDGYTHEPWVVTMAGNGTRFFVWTYGNSPSIRSLYEWDGLNDGRPMPGSYFTAGHALGRLATTASGNLLGLTSMKDTLLTNDTVMLVLPYGPLTLGPLLQAQGADTSHWSALTNLTAFSTDGRWVVGSGITVAGGNGSAREEAFRAKLVLHAEGDPALRLSTETDYVHNVITTELRWPVRDLLVAVESVSALHPELPWQAELGAPKISGQDIVLRLSPSDIPRLYRLRRLD